MKRILPMLVVSLSLLTACSEGGKSGAQKFRDALRTVPRGLMITESSKGTYPSVNTDSGTAVVTIDPIDYSVQYVVLKIEGNAMYRLRVDDMDNLNSGSVEKVKLESPVGESRTVEGSTESDEDGSIYATWNIVSRVNRQNPFCDAEETMSMSNARLTFNGVVTPLANTSMKRTFTCGRTLSVAELKALDLSNMTLCDDTIESEDEDSYSCENNKDLEYLTSDL